MHGLKSKNMIKLNSIKGNKRLNKELIMYARDEISQYIVISELKFYALFAIRSDKFVWKIIVNYWTSVTVVIHRVFQSMSMMNIENSY